MIKTRLQLLEELYDGAHVQSIQEEFLIEGIQMKIISLIRPDEQSMRQKMEGKLAEIKNSHETILKGMKKIMAKINEEGKKINDPIHLESQQPTVQP